MLNVTVLKSYISLYGYVFLIFLNFRRYYISCIPTYLGSRKEFVFASKFLSLKLITILIPMG